MRNSTDAGLVASWNCAGKICVKITAYEHVGIRVSDRDEALAFYTLLGFVEAEYFPDYPANEMVSEGGVRINLIFNGQARADRANILFDENVKHPGVTHPAFVVDDLDAVIECCAANDIAITEGPVDIGERRRALFIRDPDGNVLEFDETIRA